MPPKSQAQMVLETHTRVEKLATVLLGADGDEGLVGQVKDLADSHYKLKNRFWILVGVLIGSGVIGGGIYSVLGGA